MKQSCDEVLLTRVYELSALHTLSGAGFSEKENRSVFGPCSRLHGHDYRIEVTLAGHIDEESGLLSSRHRVDEIVDNVLISPYRGTNLSDHFRFTTGEALAIEFYRLLEDRFDPSLRLFQVRVRETAKNSFVVNKS